MADALPAAMPLRLIAVETDGYCDPVTGVCAAPEAASATPASDAQPSDEPDEPSDLGR